MLNCLSRIFCMDNELPLIERPEHKVDRPINILEINDPLL